MNSMDIYCVPVQGKGRPYFYMKISKLADALASEYYPLISNRNRELHL